MFLFGLSVVKSWFPCSETPIFLLESWPCHTKYMCINIRAFQKYHTYHVSGSRTKNYTKKKRGTRKGAVSAGYLVSPRAPGIPGHCRDRLQKTPAVEKSRHFSDFCWGESFLWSMSASPEFSCTMSWKILLKHIENHLLSTMDGLHPDPILNVESHPLAVEGCLNTTAKSNPSGRYSVW